MYISKPTLRTARTNYYKASETIEIVTPDLEDFATQILHCQGDRRALTQTVKILAMMKGFKTITPHGRKERCKLHF